MGIDSVSNVSANMIHAVNAVHTGASQLSEELIKKLKALGIDPTTVKSETEARALIAQAEKKQDAKQAHNAQFQPQVSTPNVDMKRLNDDIKAFGDKFGIDVKTIKGLKEIVDRFDVAVKEFTVAAAAQSNKNVPAQVEAVNKGVKISTGAEIVDRPERVQADFKSIKDRVDEFENAKNAMFAGQDMIAMLNRMKLGI